MFPIEALSIRQPWAWAIVHAGKRVENRSWRKGNPCLSFRGPFAIHAARGMTQDEYEGAADFMARLGVTVPAPHLLERGGIIGAARLVDIVTDSDSPWFFGPKGLVMTDVVPCNFIGCRGALGFFQWGFNECEPEAPARWMLPEELRPQTRRDRSEQARRDQGSLL